MYSAVCWCEMINAYFWFVLSANFESMRVMFYVYNKKMCLNINSMWELYLFEDIILTSFLCNLFIQLNLCP